jgi:hypothetical protein
MKLNDFMREGAGAQAELQNLIDRMFNGAQKGPKGERHPADVIGRISYPVRPRNCTPK